MVTTLADQLPETPEGNPLKVTPVAPVVAYVIAERSVDMQRVCALVPAADESVMVLLVVTVILPVAVVVPQPPVKVTV